MSIKLILLLLIFIYSPFGMFAADNRLVHEGIVAAPVKDVWAAFTTKKGQESWMVSHSEIELKIGGLMRTHYDPKGKIGDPKTIENTIIDKGNKDARRIPISERGQGHVDYRLFRSNQSADNSRSVYRFGVR
jgi:uncharacterized protein YndB with AHSA1/START domain